MHMEARADTSVVSIAKVQSRRVQVFGDDGQQSETKILDVVSVFKGKLQAAAFRSKFSDAADLIWLENRYNSSLKARKVELNEPRVGMAALRYPHLEYAFARLHIDVQACKALVNGWVPGVGQSRPGLGEMQSGLVYGR